jgi:hypothetical protein
MSYTYLKAKHDDTVNLPSEAHDGVSIISTLYYRHSAQRVYDGCHMWNRNYLPFRSTKLHSRF